MASGDGFTRPFVPRSAEWYFRQRQQRRALRLGHDGHPIRVEQIAHKEHLYRRWQRLAAEGGQGPGVDGYTYTDFSPSEVGQIVEDLSRQVLEGVYFSEPVRRVRVPKKAGSDATRELKIGTLCDRVLGSALENAFQGFWKRRFLPWSCGFIKGRGTWDMLAGVEVAMRRTGKHVLAVDDLKSAFDRVPIAAVLECHREALDGVRQKNFGRQERERTLALVEAVLRGHDRKRERGIDQGGPYSPTALNVLLNEHHDRRIKQEISRELLWWCYADNLVYLCQSMSEGGQVLQAVGSLLEPLGMTLKGEGGVKDLDQGDMAHLLGFSLWWSGEVLHLEAEPESFSQLRQHLGQSHVTPNPQRTALDVARGWVKAYAPAFEDGDVTSVLAAMSECGFREGISLMLVQGWWQDAWERWQRRRQKARRRHRDR
jgi:retron-type reverse transcriptase